MIKAIIKLAAEHGCKVTDVKRGKHYKIYLDTASGKQMLICSVSASDGRAAANNRAMIRKWSKP